MRWLVVAGLAKGGHEDRDDFYERVERTDSAGETSRWLPTEADQTLLKRETAARLRTDWELAVQSSVWEVLREIHAGGSRRINILHPVVGQGHLATVSLTITPVREEDYEADEVMIDIVPAPRHRGRAIIWDLTIRVLVCVEPPEQSWDRYDQSFSNIGEPGSLTARVTTLGALVEAQTLAESEPGTSSHYAHRAHLFQSTVEGNAVRALCGVFFVPTQDHTSLQVCDNCRARYVELPSA